MDFIISGAHIPCWIDHQATIGKAAIGIVCFGTFIYGMLAMKQLVPEVSMSFIMPVVFGGHGLVLQLLIMADEREK